MQDELTAKLRERAIREPPVGRAADSPHSSPVLRGHSKESAPSRTPRNHSVAKASIPNGVASGGRKLGGAKTRHVEEKLPATRNETKSNGVVNGNPSNGFRNRGPTRESNKRNDAADSSRNYVKTPKSELSDSKTARENDKNVAK